MTKDKRDALNRIFAAVVVGAAVGAASFGIEKGAFLGALAGVFFASYENAHKGR